MSLKEVPNSLNYCRLCHTIKASTLTVITDEIREKFSLVTDLELINSPSMSNKICYGCSMRLNSAQNYRLKLIKNEQLLFSLLKKNEADESDPDQQFVFIAEEIKQEPEEINQEHPAKCLLEISEVFEGFEALEEIPDKISCKKPAENSQETKQPKNKISCPIKGCERQFIHKVTLDLHIRDKHDLYQYNPKGCVKINKVQQSTKSSSRNSKKKLEYIERIKADPIKYQEFVERRRQHNKTYMEKLKKNPKSYEEYLKKKAKNKQIYLNRLKEEEMRKLALLKKEELREKKRKTKHVKKEQ